MCPLAGKTIQAIGFISALLGKTGGPEDANSPELPVSWAATLQLAINFAGAALLALGRRPEPVCQHPNAVRNAITLICNATAHCWPQCHCPAAQRLERMEAPLEDSYELLDEEW